MVKKPIAKYTDAYRKVHNICATYENLLQLRDALAVASELEQAVEKMQASKEEAERQLQDFAAGIETKRQALEDSLAVVQRKTDEKSAVLQAKVRALETQVTSLQEAADQVLRQQEKTRLEYERLTHEAVVSRQQQIDELDVKVGARERQLREMETKLAQLKHDLAGVGGA